MKIHFVSTEDIAIEVMSELESRFGPMALDTPDGNECMWDPGGMMMAKDEIFNFHLADITILCRAQHFDYFVNYIQQYQSRGGEIKYVKIHGKYFCICVSPSEFEQLKRLVCNAELAVKGNESMIKCEEKVDKLVENGHVVRATFDAQGKPVLSNPAFPTSYIPPKHLN